MSQEKPEGDLKMNEKRKKKIEEELKKIRELAKKFETVPKRNKPVDIFNALLDVISVPIAKRITRLELKLEHKVRLISEKEYRELQRYLDEAKALLGWDIRSLLSCIRYDQYAYFTIRKGEYQVTIERSSFFGEELSIEFSTPRGSRKFIIYSEE